MMRYRSGSPSYALVVVLADLLIAVAEAVVEDDEEDDERAHARAVEV